MRSTEEEKTTKQGILGFFKGRKPNGESASKGSLQSSMSEEHLKNQAVAPQKRVQRPSPSDSV